MFGLRRFQVACVLVLVAATNAFAAPDFVYTNDDLPGPNTVSAFRVRPDGTLAAVPGSPYPTGGTGAAGGFFASNRAALLAERDFLFVSNSGSNDISVFRVNHRSGALTAVPGSPFPSGGISTLGISLASTPDGRYLIAANSGSPNLVVFRVAASGALSPTRRRPYLLPDAPDGIKVSPNGKFLAVALPETNLIEIFNISTGGSLARVEGSPFSAFRPAGLDVNCTSDRLFAGAAAWGTRVDVFAVGATGQLAPIEGSPFEFDSGSNGNVAVLNPADNLLFVSNQDTSTVTALRVDGGGGLTLVPGSPFAIGGTAFYPAGMATDRAGKFLYVANFLDQIAVFRVRRKGRLDPVAGSPFTTGQGGGLLSLVAYPAKSCALSVNLDVLGGKVERIATRRRGKVRIAVLGEGGFDPSSIEVRSVSFEGASPIKAAMKKRKEARNRSLVLTFDASAIDVRHGSTSACIFGTLTSGRPFTGCVPLESNRDEDDARRRPERRESR